MADNVLSAPGADAHWKGALLLAFGLTAARLVALFATPLELYPDEAQYWLWSRTLDWGYFSKPPMIAWTIWTTTAIGGNSEAWVRLAAPLYHLGATLAVFGIGRRLYGPAVGFAACALYALMPGVQISALVIATDAILLFYLSLSLLAYVELPAAQGRRRLLMAAGFGAAVGLAFLAKYAAVYALIGLALHLLISREARVIWSLKSAALAVGAFLLVLAPNLAWNAAHGFSTVQHTAANANWSGQDLFNFQELSDFVLSQFGVFGPIPFAVLVGGAVVLAVRRRLQPADLLLLCFAAPPLLIVTLQSFISRANANWAGAGYVAGIVLAAAWLIRWRARWWLIGAVAMQAVVAVLFLACVLMPPLADTLGLANAFKRAKGWEQMTEEIANRAMREPAGSLSAVAVDDRFMFNAAAYYGREYFGRNGEPPLKMWVREAHPQNQAETTQPLTPELGKRVLAVSLEPAFAPEMAADFKSASGYQIVSVWLDSKRRRRAEMFIGQTFAPMPRDPVTGLPVRTPPAPKQP